MTDRRIRKALVIAAIVTSCSSAPLLAQEQGAADNDFRIEEIIVTAAKREQNLQDVAESISAVSNGAIEDFGLQDLEDMAFHVPGLQFSTDRPGTSTVTLRGLAPVAGLGSPVAIYLDEMLLNSVSSAQQDIRAYDLERVEVLRGPGGTLYGESSLGGTIKYVTNKPDSTQFESQVQGFYSSTQHGGNNSGVRGYLNVPLVEDKFAVRVVAQFDDYDGWIDSQATGAEDVNGTEVTSGRIVARYTPGDSTTVDFTAVYHDIDSGAPNISDFNYNNFAIAEELLVDDSTLLNLTIGHDLSFGTLTFSATTRDRDVSPSISDRSDLLGFLTPAFGSTAAWNNVIRFEEMTVAELRIASVNESRFRWIAGAFFKDSDMRITQIGEALPTIPDIFESTSTSNSETNALFGEFYYDLTEELEVTIGGRWFTEDRTADISQFGLFIGLPPDAPFEAQNSADETVFTPKVRLAYRPSDGRLFYVMASEGFRGGGVNTLAEVARAMSGIPDIPDGFDSERVWNYEFGTNLTMAEGRVTLNAAAFYMDWTDMQSFAAFTGAEPFAVTVNIGEAHTLGAEVELDALIGEHLNVSAALTYLEAEVDEAISPASSIVPDLPEGSKLVGVPEFRASAAARYRWPVGASSEGFISASVSYTDETVSNLIFEGPPRINDSYTLVDLSFGIEGERWSAQLFADNVTDEFVVYRTTQLVDFTSVPFGTEQLKSMGRPRTIGGRVTFSF